MLLTTSAMARLRRTDRDRAAASEERITMKTRFAMGTMALFGLSALVVAAGADEEKVPLEKVPAAIRKAVQGKFPKAQVTQAEKEVEDGKTIYEIGLEEDGHHIDVSATEDGTIVEIETEVAAQDLPRAVTDAVKAKYPKGTIKKAEEVVKGATTNYEVIVAEGSKSREVVLDRAGKILEDEESDED
jgi:uncharacterized membrane protein YkoI